MVQVIEPADSKAIRRKEWADTMARAAERLSARTVQTVQDSGLHADGKGLYLRVGPTGAKSWIFRYRGSDGNRHDLGLGPYPDITLADARERATAQRRLRLDGHDPLQTRRAGRDQARLAAAKAMTFRACAEQYIASHQAGWRNAKHGAQWSATLATYVFPVFGDLPVPMVDVALVMKAVEPIWTKKPETASRVRGRIENVLDWATARGYRQGDNPARWRGHLENLLPARSKVQRVEHHAALLPYPEIATFMTALREQEGVAARALEFLILTAARTGEVIGARWSEFDLGEHLWKIPGERMKAGREHRVPLSARALAIVEAMHAEQGRSPDPAAFMFPGAKEGRPLSQMALLMLLRRMGRADLTAHGFRSSFRDWAAERTSFPAEVAEMALAHVVGDKVEAAYRRGDLFAKRRQLAEAWAKFCAQPPASGMMVPLRA
ncbi:MAG: tyrosine-type recombinase/integrase [Stellaceae bacterium]